MNGLHAQRRAGLWSACLALGVAHAIPAQARSCAVTIDSLTTTTRWTPPLDRAITLHATDVSLRDALDRVAASAKLRVSYSAELLPLDRAVCVSANRDPVGKVFGALLGGTNLTVVAAGGDQVVLTPRSTSTARAAVERSRAVNVLDRVVVTGSAAGAPQREAAVGVDVIDGRDLARNHTNTLAGVLDAYVPGMWSWTQSPSSMLSSYASIRGASSFGLSYPKIYIDGIEVANPLLVSRFNPSAIDRIEVIRGPQGSALYGTDAISGVINIVTRHEGANGDGSHASVRTAAGLSQSSYARDVLAQDHALSIVTGSSTRSADLHVSAGSIGSFIPDGYSRDLMATGSTRMVGERATFAATARFFAAEAGTPTSPLIPGPTIERPDSLDHGTVFRQSTEAPQSVRQYTLATTTTFAPDQAWTHTLVAGIDGYRLSNVQASFTPIRSAVDSALRAAQGGADRATIRASSVLHVVNGEASRATLTFSAEHARLRETSLNNLLIQQGGRSPIASPTVGARQLVSWQNSTGLTTQANLAYSNSLFITGGMRIEHDSRLAPLQDFVFLPMLGAATVRDYGALSVKLRAAYGKGIRPPSTVVHSPFGQTSSALALQSLLGPEVQSGTEAGIDLSFKRGPSLQITRFDQRASGLVQQVPLDTSPMIAMRRFASAVENVGEISNRGWEVEASGSLSRLAITGAYSHVDSRVQKLAMGYTGDLASGDRILQVPAHTASLTFSWLANRWTSSLGASHAFDWINYDELALTKAFLNGTHEAREPLGLQLRQYWRRYNGGLRLRAAASRDIRDMLSIDISAENLLNHQRGEPDNITVVPGRTIMSGVRVKF